MKHQNKKAVQGTNDSSAVSKSSMVSKGYFDDAFISSFVAKKARRAPLIHRGYYIRAKAIQYVFNHFLRSCKDKIQIISLGAGSDSSFFRLTKDGVLEGRAIYFEVDFPQVVSKKSDLIMNNVKLKELLKFRSEDDINTALKNNIFLNSENYKLLGVDLQNLAQLNSLLLSCGINKTIPTLIFCECVLMYMKVESSSALIQWAAAEFPNSLFASYEQVFPDDGFGLVMLSHFQSIGSPLKSIHHYPDLDSQKKRYLELGWKQSAVIGMNSFYQNLIDKEEKERITNLEPFDEFEEWHLKCSHYFLVCAVKGNCCLPFDLLTSSVENSHYSLHCKWNYQPQVRNIERFGHTTSLLHSQFYLTVAGFGKQNGCHQRLEDITVFKLFKDNSSVQIKNKQLIGHRIHHTTTVLSNGLIVVIGGRTSPLKPCLNNVIVEIEEIEEDSQHHLGKDKVDKFSNANEQEQCMHFICKSIPTSESESSPRWRHSATSIDLNGQEFIFISGGCSVGKAALDDHYLLNTSTWKWKKIPDTAGKPLPLHSHSVCNWRNQPVISGGLTADLVPVNCVHILNCETFSWSSLHVSGQLPRYSHTSHVVNDTLYLIGGVNCDPYNVPGVAVIDLVSKSCHELTLPSQSPEYPILLHNHDSTCDQDEVLRVFGGGGNCFSFGTHLNQGIVEIDLKQLETDLNR